MRIVPPLTPPLWSYACRRRRRFHCEATSAAFLFPGREPFYCIYFRNQPPVFARRTAKLGHNGLFCIRAVGLEHRVRRDEQQGGAAGAAICEIQNNKGFVGKGFYSGKHVR